MLFGNVGCLIIVIQEKSWHVVVHMRISFALAKYMWILARDFLHQECRLSHHDYSRKIITRVFTPLVVHMRISFHFCQIHVDLGSWFFTSKKDDLLAKQKQFWTFFHWYPFFLLSFYIKNIDDQNYDTFTLTHNPLHGHVSFRFQRMTLSPNSIWYLSLFFPKWFTVVIWELPPLKYTVKAIGSIEIQKTRALFSAKIIMPKINNLGFFVCLDWELFQIYFQVYIISI